MHLYYKNHFPAIIIGTILSFCLPLCSTGCGEKPLTGDLIITLPTASPESTAASSAPEAGNQSTSASSAGNTSSSTTEALPPGNPDALIISEYVEGSSYNKYLEICNISSNTAYLGHYLLAKQSNEGDDLSLVASFDSTLPLADVSSTLAPGAVLVLANSRAEIWSEGTSFNGGSLLAFNGNDALALFYAEDGESDWQLTDLIGDNSSTYFARDVTLIRKEGSLPSPYWDPDQNWRSLPADCVSNLGRW